MRRLLVVLVLFGFMLSLGGCLTAIAPSDRAVIQWHTDNVVAMNKKIEPLKFKVVNPDGTETDAPWVKEWWKDEQNTWTWLNDWANRRSATTLP